MNQEIISKAVNSLAAQKIHEANLNGHGETTILTKWHELVDPLIQSDIECNLITNASKRFSVSELEILSRFNMLTISCDSLHPDVYNKLRRGGSLTNIFRAIHGIREKAQERGSKPPKIGFSCVLGADNAPYLEHYLMGSKLMSLDFIQFCHLTEYPQPPDADYILRPLSALSKEGLEQVKDLLLEARQFPRPSVSLQSGIMKAIDSLLKQHANNEKLP
jgi:wyosine [tRNA(Phe)-imidazoG37] synthetase (radical SAM superfamily)